MFNFNRSVKKFCEYCNNLVDNPYYTVLFSVSHLIDSSHPSVIKVDRQNQIVYISGDQPYEYSFEIEPGVFIKAEVSTEHLLCSESCEDDFVGKHFVNYIKGNYPVYNYRKLKIFSPIAIPSLRLGGEQRTCAFCGCKYKLNGRDWLKCKVRDSIKVEGAFDQRPNFDLNKYEIVLSGLSAKNPNGYWYGYEPDYETSEKIFLCSYDCAYELVRETSNIIFVNSVLEKERYGAIVKDSEYFNNLLGNASHRPSFFKSMFDETKKSKKEFNPDYRDTILYNGYIPYRATGNFLDNLIEFEQFNNPEQIIHFNSNLTKAAYLINHNNFELIRRKDLKDYSNPILINQKGNYLATGRIFYNKAGVGILMELMLENNPLDTMYFQIPDLNNEIVGKKCLEIVLK